MLPDHLSQLLTAYVDGETSPGQSKTIERLLAKAPEARTLLNQLQSDRRRLRELPRRHVDADFAGHIIQLAVGLPHLAPRLAAPRRAKVRAWTVPAAAAAILAIVGLISYGVFHKDRRDQPNLANADREQTSHPPAAQSGHAEIVDIPVPPPPLV